MENVIKLKTVRFLLVLIFTFFTFFVCVVQKLDPQLLNSNKPGTLVKTFIPEIKELGHISYSESASLRHLFNGSTPIHHYKWILEIMVTLGII